MKPTLKISPSQLEEYRNLKVGNYEPWGKTQDDFVAGLTRGFEESAATSRGHAVHAILEGKSASQIITGTTFADDENGLCGKVPTEWHYKIYEPNFNADWLFSDAAYQVIVSNRTPDAAFEVWGFWEGEVSNTNVRMNMRFDALQPCLLHDFKTTGSKKYYRDYLESIQWRCYLMALPEVQTVHYHIFQMPKEAEPNKLIGWCRHEPFTFVRERDNEQRVMVLLEDLIAWAKDDERVWSALKYEPK